MSRKTIQVQKETKDMLAGFGNLSSTYDSVIRELIEHARTCGWWTEEKG